MQRLGIKVEGLGFGVWVWGLGFRLWGLGLIGFREIVRIIYGLYRYGILMIHEFREEFAGIP